MADNSQIIDFLIQNRLAYSKQRHSCIQLMLVSRFICSMVRVTTVVSKLNFSKSKQIASGFW